MYAVALFDIDGTLCDPGNGITSAMQYALGRLGIEEPDQAALRRFVGPPLEHSFRDHYGLDPGQVGEAVAHYRRHYGDRGMSEYRPYSGVDALLGRLASRGVRLGVVTAKVQGFAEEALRRTGLLPYFDTVAGRAPDEVVTKAVTLAQALDAVGVHAATVVMIGDREHDVHAARANGIDSIGVLYGFGTAEELAAAGATYLAGSPGDIERVVVSG